MLEAIVHHLDSLSTSDGMMNAKRLINKYDIQLRTDNKLSENQKEQFVLVNSDNAYIYDPEKKLAIESGLPDVSYS